MAVLTAPNLGKPTSTLMPVAPHPRLWTCAEFEKLAEVGLLSNDHKYMLIDGVILEKPPMNHPHALSVELIDELLKEVFRPGWRVRAQLPLNLDELNNPFPDIAVIPGRARDATEHPTRAALIVEVSDTTLDLDQRIKRERYAQAGIPEYWIVDINSRMLLVFRDPVDDAYATALTLSESDTVAPLAKPEAVIKVADLLP